MTNMKRKPKNNETVILSASDLRRFARFEISYDELMQGKPDADVEAPEPYQITPEDLKEAVINFRKSGISEDQFGAEYFWPLSDKLFTAAGLGTARFGPEDGFPEGRQMPDAYSVFSDAWSILVWKYIYAEDGIDLDGVITEIQIWEDNREKPLPEREYTRSQKQSFLGYWDDDRLAASAGDDVKAAYRKILDSLCEEDDISALETKAYACYGYGNAAYGQNWPESQKCLLRLMELRPDPQTANTLGYMYYYGRCTNGDPEYDKAFYYFSIGAAGWYYESRYKLSDMFRHGYGTPKNPKAAAALIWELYKDQLERICDEQYGSNFADVALRAGNLWKEGIDCWPDSDRAYYYYLQAQYAIQMRMQTEDNYGDRKVAAGIEQAIAEILPATRSAKQKKTVHYVELYSLLQNGLEKRHHMEMKTRRISDTEAKLTFRIVPYASEAIPPKLFVTAPEAHFCGLMKKVSVNAKHLQIFDVPEGTDTVLFDSIEGDCFYLYGKKVAEINGDFVFTAPRSKEK